MSEKKSAILIGATGLVGGHLLRLLADDDGYDKVLVLARRDAPKIHDKIEWRVIDFDRPASFNDAGRADDVYCCLGTTIRQAGSQEAFKKVDFEYPLALGRSAKAAGSKQLLVVTALGVKKSSPIFYNRVKAELEESLAALQLPRLVLVRPSILVGDREQSRPGEHAAIAAMSVVGPLMLGPLRKYRAIEGRTVARAMLRLAQRSGAGVEIVSSDELEALGKAA